MFSTTRQIGRCSVYIIALAALMTTTVAAQSPCVQSPEEVHNTGDVACPRCRPSLCELSCFTCENIMEGAASCNTGKSCSTDITIPNVSMTVGVAGCPVGEGWAMRNIKGPVAAKVACKDGKVTAFESIRFSASGAEGTGSLCTWSYKNLSVSATWKAGGAPSLMIGGWPRGTTRITDLTATSSGTNFSMTGNVAAPLADGMDYHRHSPVMLQLSITAACSCN